MLDLWSSPHLLSSFQEGNQKQTNQVQRAYGSLIPCRSQQLFGFSFVPLTLLTFQANLSASASVASLESLSAATPRKAKAAVTTQAVPPTPVLLFLVVLPHPYSVQICLNTPYKSLQNQSINQRCTEHRDRGRERGKGRRRGKGREEKGKGRTGEGKRRKRGNEKGGKKNGEGLLGSNMCLQGHKYFYISLYIKVHW